MNHYVPTKGDIEIIKRAASRETGVPVGAVLMEPGWRCNTTREVEASINIALVSDDPAWNDTDLADYGTWAEFRKGIELTADGRAIIDLYIHRRFDEERELHGNIELYVEGGKLVRILGYGKDRVRWEATQ
jgi:hypothetical protein